jgi:hypothetical protein
VTGQFTVIARDANLNRIGDASAYTSLEVHPRFNDVGAWSLVYPAGLPAAQLFAAGGGVLIYRRGAADTGDHRPGDWGDVETLGDGFAEPVVTVSGACDNYYLGTRLALPDAGCPAVGAGVAVRRPVRCRRDGDEGLRQRQPRAGRVRPASRRLAHLTIEADGHRGASVAFSARFDNLLTVLQKLAVTGGLGFKVKQVGSALVFSVYSRSTGPHPSGSPRSTGSARLLPVPADRADGHDSDRRRRRIRCRPSRSPATPTPTAESDWSMRVEAFVDMASTTDVTQVVQGGQQALDTRLPAGAGHVRAAGHPAGQLRHRLRPRRHRHRADRPRPASSTSSARSPSPTTPPAASPSPRPSAARRPRPSATPTIYRQLRSALVAIGLLQRRR